VSARLAAAAGVGSLADVWFCAEPPPETRQSTMGRPRRLTDQKVAWVLAEYSRYLEWRTLRATVKSQRQLARELGVSQATVSLAIRSRGRYKQSSPELRSKRRPAKDPAVARPEGEDEGEDA
jgi:transposase